MREASTNMASTRISETEYEITRGLSTLAQIIYFRVFRRHMNYHTGVVGDPQHRISWKTLQRECAFTPDVRSKKPPYAPTRGEIRAAIAELERQRDYGEPIGVTAVVEDQGSSYESGYLKRLLWAELDSSGQNMNNPRTTPEQPHNNNPEKRSNGETLSGMSNPLEHQPMADEPPMFRGSEDQEERGTHVPVEFASANIDGAATTAPPVPLVFKYWQQRLNHPRAKLDRKRQRAIAARLKDGYSIDDLKRAIDGCRASPWHQGQNDKRRTFDDIELICRDAAHVEQFMAIGGEQSAEQQRLDDWLNEDRIIDGGRCHVG